MYIFRIGVVGSYLVDAGDEALDRMLNEAFDQLGKDLKVKFEVAVHTSGKVAQRARACATARGWNAVAAATLPGTDPIILYDGMVRIGGGDAEKKQLARFKRRLNELPGDDQPIVEYD